MAGDLDSGGQLAKQWSLPEELPAQSGNTEEEKTAQHLKDSTVEQSADPPTSENTAEVVAVEQVDEAPAEEVTTEQNSDEPSATEQTTETSNEEPAEVHADTEEKPVVKLETAPADFRFPTTNQTRHCFTRYIEYHRCIQAKGEDAPECNKFAKYYRSLCPSEWVERWNEQRENGTFPGPL